jgi:Zn-dependent protease with chaperone function
MQEDAFVAVVKKAEASAEKNIAAYRRKLIMLGLLGYVVIFSALAMLLGMTGGLIALAIFSSSLFLLLIKKKAIFLILFAIWALLRALWVKIDAPSGYELTREKYPRLFDEIDALTSRLDALHIDQVILETNFNAAVLQTPRYGIFGGQRNTLFLGLELMLALSPEQLRSVLAHEFGHLSGNHSKFGGWIYRVRLRWQRIMEAMEQNDAWGTGLMRRFFNWYSPYFAAYSFPLARHNEYEADAISAELTNAQVAASALVNVHALAPNIEQRYWKAFFEQADEQASPPHKPFEGLAAFLKDRPISSEEMQTSLQSALKEETNYADTHPCLNERLAALSSAKQQEANAYLMPQEGPSAAEFFLGEGLSECHVYFDDHWMAENREQWASRYEYVRESKKVLEAYQAQSLQELDEDAHWDYAIKMLEFESEEKAEPLLRRFLELHPQSPGAGYYLGEILFNRKDEECLEKLRLAFSAAAAAEHAAQMGYHYLSEAGRERDAEQWWQEATVFFQRHHEAAMERNIATKDDKWSSPNIDAGLKQQLQDILQSHPKVARAWLAQKETKHNPEDPVYAVAIKLKGFSFSEDDAVREIAANLKLDAHIFVVALSGEQKSFAKKLKKLGEQLL